MGWRTENTQCYDEMFCEPTRASLVRRPGNTYSNVFYLFGALAVLLSTLSADCVARRSNAFRVADAMFGAMMLILALLSVTWHASNAPKSQYVDLWAMNSCIVYLIVRISEEDVKLAQKMGQLQPFIAVLPQECMGQLASFGPP